MHGGSASAGANPGHVPAAVRPHLSAGEESYLARMLHRFDGFPDLEQVWALMDESWVELGCDPLNLDERAMAFYRHPVWLLNGLFVEQDAESLSHRRVLADWITQRAPARIADFGGGFGGLARLVGAALPAARVEVVEPHPHPAAIALAASTANVRFVPALSGEYDLLIATDVFEHVPDPIGLAAETAAQLRVGGVYLMANCFQPLILCHLPQLFHLHYAWDAVMKAMGLTPGEPVAYGRAYYRAGPRLDVDTARRVGERARRLHPLLRRLPRGQARAGRLLMRLLAR